MFINADSIRLNGISMGQYLLSAKYEYNKLWGSDTGRNLKGKFSGTLVGIFPKITLTFRKLTKAEMNIIAPILNSGTQSLTYYDPDTNSNKTISTYTGDWSYENKQIMTKNNSFDCTFIARERFKENLIELGRELRGVITYGNTTLEEEIYSITPHYNADLLKSVMKQLDIELSVDIPLNTIINCQIGIKVNNNYEMLNYGNYVVYKSEKQEDTNTYKLTCYDKMLYSMKKNEKLEIEYPISIKDYLNAVANKIGLSVATTTFYNENMKIPSELYLGQDYTYRDILDEIAQATGSIICLNENDEIVVKYPTKTNDTIDEEFLKDVNVDFGQMYGAINTIVLSRSGESDNIYYPETLPENPIEIKIKDNQIMNFNNRSDYLQGIYNALNGLYYYINDFTSTGILYYDVGDLYNVRIGM